MKKFAFLTSALLAAAVLTTGCQQGGGADPNDPLVADASGVRYAASFDQAVMDAAKQDKYVLVKFTANWCTPCHAMSDEMKETDLSQQFAKIIPVEVDIDKEADGLAVKEHLPHPSDPAIPYIVLLDKSGKEVANHLGRLPMDEFKAWLEKNVKA
jgi:thiol:disulfide interchange protein